MQQRSLLVLLAGLAVTACGAPAPSVPVLVAPDVQASDSPAVLDAAVTPTDDAEGDAVAGPDAPTPVDSTAPDVAAPDALPDGTADDVLQPEDSAAIPDAAPDVPAAVDVAPDVAAPEDVPQPADVPAEDVGPATCQSSKQCPGDLVCNKTKQLCVECLVPEDCSAGHFCQAEVCIPTVCQPNLLQCSGNQLGTCKADGSGWDLASCEDGDACTVDGCTGTACTHAAKSCDDGNACTSDSCDKANGCSNIAKSGACDDGSACTSGEACVGGVCKVGAVGTVGTIAGSGTAGYLDGPSSSAQFSDPIGVAALPDGGLLVTEWNGQRIRKVAADGSVSTFAGSGTAGGLDGASTSAQFNNPGGILRAADGTVYVSEWSGHRIRKITPDGTVSTLAGNGTAGFVDGNGAAARFNMPGFMTFDAYGSIVVADWANNAIRRVTTDGAVYTLAGWSAIAGSADGPLVLATLNLPFSVAYDPAGNLYIVEQGRIRRLGIDGVVSTVFGNGSAGFSEAVGKAGLLSLKPHGILWHPQGFLVVADRDNFRLRAIWPDGTNTTLAGSGAAGYVDGPGNAAQFVAPTGVLLRQDGTIAVTDGLGQRVRNLSLPTTACNDNKPCTFDSCNAATGLCVFAAVSAGTSCEDGSKCTSGDTCDAVGTCSGTAVTCDDGNPCTDDACDLIGGGCVHKDNELPCEDNNLCTVGTVCAAASCGAPVNCDDGNPCTADSCSAGNCSHVAIANCCASDAACDDSDACTLDSCKPMCDGTTWNGSCYKALFATLTWATAEAQCVAWGGHLTSIGSAGENSTVQATAKSVCGVQKTYIGGNDMAVEGSWHWNDGTPWTWANWSSGEPNNATCGTTGEDGSQMLEDGTWNDTCLSYAAACSVCEKPAGPGTCLHAPNPSCCTSDAACDDGDKCTTDTCKVGTGCVHTPNYAAGCCVPDVWSDDFEAGDVKGTLANSLGVGKGWQVWGGSGLAHSGTNILYYGDPVAKNYAFSSGLFAQGSSGTWTFTVPFPAASGFTLTFWLYADIEAQPVNGKIYDNLWLTASGATLWPKPNPLTVKTWQKITISAPLTAFSGLMPQFVLHFDTVDNQNNTGLGVLIDDVQITRNCP